MGSGPARHLLPQDHQWPPAVRRPGALYKYWPRPRPDRRIESRRPGACGRGGGQSRYQDWTQSTQVARPQACQGTLTLTRPRADASRPSPAAVSAIRAIIAYCRLRRAPLFWIEAPSELRGRPSRRNQAAQKLGGMPSMGGRK